MRGLNKARLSRAFSARCERASISLGRRPHLVMISALGASVGVAPKGASRIQAWGKARARPQELGAGTASAESTTHSIAPFKFRAGCRTSLGVVVIQIIAWQALFSSGSMSLRITIVSPASRKVVMRIALSARNVVGELEMLLSG
jgi:hypothetical protein